MRRVDPKGILTTIAGVDGLAAAEPAGVATEQALDGPAGIALDAAGDLFIADSNNERIVKVDPKGKMTVVAGTGHNASTGDDGPALKADLADPELILLDPDGDLLIAEGDSPAIRRLDQHGLIHAFAGTGEAGYAGDGGAASKALLNDEEGVKLTMDRAGDILFADEGNGVIRIVDRAGIIQTYAAPG